MTRDIDVVVALGEEDVDVIARLFMPDYFVSQEAIRDAVQIRDVKNLLATGYDSAYLERWASELAIDALLRECLA